MPLHLPTYNYCSPFTNNFHLIPKNELDYCCKIHDIEYGDINIGNIDADQKLIKCTENIDGIASFLVRNIIKTKNFVIPPSTTKKNRIRTI